MHAVTTHLAGAMTTKEDHVLQTVKTNWAHGLKGKKILNILAPGREMVREYKVWRLPYVKGVCRGKET